MRSLTSPRRRGRRPRDRRGRLASEGDDARNETECGYLLRPADRPADPRLSPDPPVRPGRIRRGLGGRAPGGFRVALKLVRLSGKNPSGELRAIEVVRGIRHSNLLPIFGAWQVDDVLVIGSELADRSLWDRFLEAIAQGLRGIPRGELLGYLEAAATGLDFLNAYRHAVDGRERVGVQHRDVKPQNILLFGGSAKVADFGMVRVMDASEASHTGSWTLPYAAPEFFRGKTSRQSDQVQPGRDLLPSPGRPVAVRRDGRRDHGRAHVRDPRARRAARARAAGHGPSAGERARTTLARLPVLPRRAAGRQRGLRPRRPRRGEPRPQLRPHHREVPLLERHSRAVFVDPGLRPAFRPSSRL